MNKKDPFSFFQENECSCSTCQNMCIRPCWPTPKETKALMDAGYSDRLMKDFFGATTSLETDTILVCPASKGYEGKEAPFDPRLGCTFFKEGKCELHEKGLKPLEGRLATCKDDHPEAPNLHEIIANTWDTEEGKMIAKEWCESKGMKSEIEASLEDQLIQGLMMMIGSMGGIE